MEKPGAAARAIDDSMAAGERFRRWKMSLLNRATAASGILQELTVALSDRWGPAIGLTLRPLRKAVRAA